MRRSSTRDAGMVWAVLLIASCAGKHRNSDSDAGISGGAAGAGAGGNGTGGSGTVGTGAGGSGTVGTGAGGSGTAGTGSAGRSAGGMSFGGTGFGGTGFGGTGFGGTGFGGIAPDGGGALGTGATGAGRGGTAGASAGRGGTAGALADGGGAGGRGGVSGSGGTAGSAGNCAADLGRCARNADCCGFATGRNLCIDTGDPTLGLACLITCTQGTECQSGCCAPLESGDHVYGPAALCGNCAADLEACTQNSDCCGFSTGDNVCVDTGPSPAGIGVACLIVCTSGTECQSGCCAAVNGSAGARVCAPTSACG